MTTMFKGRVKAIHFIGIGGIGMSGIAELLLNLGFEVTGSDLKESDTTKRLSDLGGHIFFGHQASHVRRADVVVFSSAVKRDNPEIVEARRCKIPIIPRAEMLAELMRLKYGVAIAGSHGKTTTTSLVATVLDGAGLDPTVVIGGKLNSLGSNARLGQGNCLVAEADESDGSFLKLSPTIAVVTNIDPEHMDYYGTVERLNDTFLDFINKVPFYGLAILCLECPNVRSLLPKVEKRFVTYGWSEKADYHVKEIEQKAVLTRFVPIKNGAPLAPVELKMVGRHNVLNALAAVAVADELKIPYEKAHRALRDFSGVQRRFTVRGEANGVMIVDDYGHHPTEIKATLAGAKDSFQRRVIAIFQPHRFTRTHHLFDQFAAAFSDADVVFVTSIYAAGEAPIAGVSSEKLAEAIREQGKSDVIFCENHDALLKALLNHVKPGDLVVTLGAGDIWRVGHSLLEALR